MRYLLLATFFLAFSVVDSAAQNMFTYKIEGAVDSIADGMEVHLTIYPPMAKAIAATTMVRNGKFYFKGQLAEPAEASLHTGKFDSTWSALQRISFWAEGKKIKFRSHGPQFAKGIITGSPVSTEAALFEKTVINEDSNPVDAIVQSNLFHYIGQHPDSYVGAAALVDYKFYMPLPTVNSAYHMLSAVQKQTATGRQLLKYVSLNKGLKPGDKAPDFTVMNAEGKKVSLADFKGDYVLLDFIAVERGGFVVDYKNINRANDLYAGRNFRLVSIWLNGEQELRKGLVGKPVKWITTFTDGGYESDLAYLYGLNPAPSMQVLIDKEGTIVMTGRVQLLPTTDGQFVLPVGKRAERLFYPLDDILNNAHVIKEAVESQALLNKNTDTITRNGLTLYFKDPYNSFTAAYKQRFVDAYFQQYPKLVAKYNTESPKAVTFFIDKMYGGIAEAGGSMVHFNPAWFEKNPEDIDVITHETMHLVQGYGYNGVPGWVTEGIADYVRATEGFNNEKADWSMPALAPQHRYDNAYRITARFFVWITQQYDKEFVKDLDDAARRQVYSNDTWKALTGKTVEELWQEYVANPALKS